MVMVTRVWRRSGVPVLVNGRIVPLVGRVSMDVDGNLGPDAVDQVGDDVTLWGEGWQLKLSLKR